MYRIQDVELPADCIRGAIHVASSIARTTVGLGNGASPLVSAHFESLRVAAAIAPVALDGDCLCIRKHRKARRTLQRYVEDGSFAHLLRRWERTLPKWSAGAKTEEGGAYFTRLMERGTSILVSGTPSGGKSTFVDTLVSL